jgi:hypothetical protein
VNLRPRVRGQEFDSSQGRRVLHAALVRRTQADHAMMLIGLRSLILAGLLSFSAPALAQRPEPGEVIDQVARYTGFTNDTVSLALKDNAAALDRLTVDRIQAETRASTAGR